MAQQVSGSDKTLIQAIRDGDVPRPALMRWNEWQAWRTSSGRRPRQATDGYTVSQAQESAIWKSVMVELYGTERSVQLASMDDGTAAAREAAADLGGAPAAESAFLLGPYPSVLRVQAVV